MCKLTAAERREEQARLIDEGRKLGREQVLTEIRALLGIPDEDSLLSLIDQRIQLVMWDHEETRHRPSYEEDPLP